MIIFLSFVSSIFMSFVFIIPIFMSYFMIALEELLHILGIPPFVYFHDFLNRYFLMLKGLSSFLSWYNKKCLDPITGQALF